MSDSINSLAKDAFELIGTFVCSRTRSGVIVECETYQGVELVAHCFLDSD